MKLIKHKVRHVEGPVEFDTIPDVFEDRSYPSSDINKATYLGSTIDGHEVLRLDDGNIVIIYSIDLDWYKE
jgi:hypothetical protein